MNEVREYCAEWLEDDVRRCGERAVAILWGKLFPPDALGPRCRVHAERHLPVPLSQAIRESWAIFDLRGLRRSPEAVLKKGTW